MYSLATAKIMTSAFMFHSFGENVAINHCSDKHTRNKWKINMPQAQNANGNLNPEDKGPFLFSHDSTWIVLWGAVRSHICW